MDGGLLCCGGVGTEDLTNSHTLAKPRARTWRGREILGATCCCAAISFHCATQPTVRATANSTVNMLTGTCGGARTCHASPTFLYRC